MKKIIVIDGNSLANRAFYAMPYLSNRNKQPSGAVYGFANLLTKIISEQKPDYLAVAFDHSRKTFRSQIFEGYKATRKETPQELRSQFPVIKQMLEIMGVKVFEQDGIEADDIIGTIAKTSNIKNFLVSGDKDLLQLIDTNTHVWLTRKGVTDIEEYDEAHLFERYGFKPSGIIDLKALMGDSSDNIPGVMGIGEKTALSLLSNYCDLDGVYENIGKITGKLKEKLENEKQSAYMSKELATIKTDCDINFNLEDCKYKFPFSQNVFDFFVEWDFKSLASRKNLFEIGVKEQKKEVKKAEFQSLEEIQNFADNIKDVFCYDFNSLEFASINNVYCLKKELDLFSANIDLSEAIKILKPVFENERILKITNSSKEDIKLLKKYEINLANFFDIEIARYVLYAGLTKLPTAQVSEMLSEKYELEKKLVEQKVDNIYRDIEIPLVKVLAEMEMKGFKIDQQNLNLLSEKFNTELSELSEKIFQLAGETFNLKSPKQVAHILFEKLGLFCYNNKKQSTNIAVLEEIRSQHEIVDLIIEHRKIYKLVSTYINVYKSICENSGPIIHTSFNQTLTSTGRLSSSEPNLQNIPTRDETGKTLRKIFVSKFDDGQIISADYSQIELRLLANLAKEEAMIAAYKNGVDIHTKTASEIFGVPISAVTSAQRSDAKAVNFGIIYGISDFGLSQNIKASRASAKNYIETYFNRYPKIKEFMDANIEYAEKNGFVKSYFGRIRHIPEMSSSNANIRNFAKRVAMNMPLQGTASDVIKIAMIEVSNKLKNMKSHIILQIHDELIVDAPASEVDEVKKILKTCMENVCKFAVPLTISVSSGKNLFECK